MFFELTLSDILKNAESTFSFFASLNCIDVYEKDRFQCQQEELFLVSISLAGEFC